MAHIVQNLGFTMYIAGICIAYFNMRPAKRQVKRTRYIILCHVILLPAKKEKWVMQQLAFYRVWPIINIDLRPVLCVAKKCI